MKCDDLRMVTYFRRLMRCALILIAIVTVAHAGNAQFHLRAGVSHQSIQAVVLTAVAKDPSRTYTPDANLRAFVTSVPIGIRWSGANQAADFGIDLALSSLNLTGGGVSTQVLVWMPSLNADFYFLNGLNWLFGSGLQMRHSGAEFSRRLQTIDPSTSMVLSSEANTKWSGFGYRLSAIGKYVMDTQPLDIRFNLGYALDYRHLKSMQLDGNSVPRDERRNVSRLSTEGIEITIGLNYAF